MGPTGSGKTELARTLSTLSNSPFIKVEATQYTEIGYHGKDVDNIINELAAKTLRKITTKITELAKSMSTEMTNLINLILLDFMLGQDYKDLAVREQKLKNLSIGLYDDLYVNAELPSVMEELKFNSVEEYLAKITNPSTNDLTQLLIWTVDMKG